MLLESNRILVKSDDGHIHVADMSDITAHTVTEESKQTAITAYLHKYHLTPLSSKELTQHGYTNEVLEKRHKRALPQRQIELPRR